MVSSMFSDGPLAAFQGFEHFAGVAGGFDFAPFVRDFALSV